MKLDTIAVLRDCSKKIGVVLALLLLPASVQTAHAQFVQKWLTAGELQHGYSEAGGAFEGSLGAQIGGLQMPPVYPYEDAQINTGLWVAAKDIKGADGKTYPARVAHVGPRVSGRGEVFPQRFDMVSRFEPPKVVVDGLETFKHPVVNDEVKPSMKPARVLVNKLNTVLGITVTRRIMQFSQEYHDNYHIVEYTLKNTGNVDNDDEAELNQTVKGVRLATISRYGVNEVAGNIMFNGARWGKNTMVDYVGDGMEDYETDFRASVIWGGRMPDFQRWNNLGGPVLDDAPEDVAKDEDNGRLASSQFMGWVTLHADKRAHKPGESVPDDRSQPSTTKPYNTDDPLSTQNDAFNKSKMQEEYKWISSGHEYPHQADQAEPPEGSETDSWGAKRFAQAENDPSLGVPGGFGAIESIGPYTLKPGQTVRIVRARAVSDLSEEAAREIGAKYKKLWQNDNLDAPIEYDADGDGTIQDDERMTKNMWVMTSRDSLFKSYGRAIANYKSNYNIPHAPLPPKQFTVTSKTGRVQLSWKTYADANPQGYEVYRAEGKVYHPYKRVAKLDGSAKGYKDKDVQRGVGYFYYVQAVGEVNNDDTGHTPTGVRLKSNQYYTQTWAPASLKRNPGSSLEAVRVVPNPYNISSSPNVRYPDQQDRIGFLDIPAQATIRIYTESGERVETINHDDGSGDEYWDLTTYSNQLIASGLYIAVIEDRDTGEQIIRKFSVIR